MIKASKFKKPPAYHVYVTVHPNARNGVMEAFVARIGTTNDPAKIPVIIADDKRVMQDTFGGLIAPTSTNGRTYHTFKATWEEVK